MKNTTPDEASYRTLAHYDGSLEGFWSGTKDHDVSQNYAALISAMGDRGHGPFSILDVGCGPGRDVMYFKSLGHSVTGLDGSQQFVEHARELTGCEILHQDFMALDLPGQTFDGIFANASLFHIPSHELARVLAEFAATLKPDGVLFSSNPRGNNQEGFQGERYCCYHDYDTWFEYMTAAGFTEIRHYYRPKGLPRDQQPWLASVWSLSQT